MEKSIHSDQYAKLLTLLRRTRQRAGLTQVDIAERIGESQSFVSKCERGERRLDVIELRAFCAAMGVAFREFITALERKLGSR